MTLAREARQRGWWQSYSSNAVPEWFQVYLGLEAEAASIDEYAAEFVPGLFQTAEYYRAFMGTAPCRRGRRGHRTQDRGARWSPRTARSG